MAMEIKLRGNETLDDFFNRCNNATYFDCSEEEMLWWLMGSRRLPLSEIVPISIVLVVIFLTGVVGNICVCVVIVKHPGLHTATNYYLFSLAVSDLLLLLFDTELQKLTAVLLLLPFAIVGGKTGVRTKASRFDAAIRFIFVAKTRSEGEAHLQELRKEALKKSAPAGIGVQPLVIAIGLPNDLSVYWHQYPYSLGIVFCKLRAFISEAATYVSVLTISAFSLERYLAICQPLHLYAMAGLTRASRIILVLWIISAVCASPLAVYTDISYREYPPNSGNISTESAFCALMAPSPLLELSSIFFFFVPGILILCLYVRMGLHIRTTKVSEKTKMGLLNGQVHGETRQAKSRKAIIRMLAAVVVAFFVCWAPFHIQRLFYIYGYTHPQFQVINEHLFNVAGALYYVSATVNPILYNVMSGRYRVAFQETLLCRKVRRDSRFINMDHTSASSKASQYRKRESRIAFVSKVDYVKEDPAPFCDDNGDVKMEDSTVFYFYDDKQDATQIDSCM